MEGNVVYLKYGIFVFLPILNFFIWLLAARYWSSLTTVCTSFSPETFTLSRPSLNESIDCIENDGNDVCALQFDPQLPQFRPILTNGLVSYKADSLINVRYPEWSTLLQPQNSKVCERIVNPHISRKKQYSCLAVVTVTTDNTFNLLRYEVNLPPNTTFDNSTSKRRPPPPAVLPVKKKAPTTKKKVDLNQFLNDFNATGFFINVANDNGRLKQTTKMVQFLTEFNELESHVKSLLLARNLLPGDDVVVMVVNTGELDILANFVCSCHAHNISMHNMMVFAGSEDIVPIIESFGVIGIYHRESFANVSKSANYEYLDPIFIDMMWYKSFSVWLLLKLRYNVLFQDVDVVWYRSPFKYFHDKVKEYKPEQPLTYGGNSSSSSNSGGNHHSNGPSVFNRLVSSIKDRTHDFVERTHQFIERGGSGEVVDTSFHTGEVGIQDHSHIDPPDAFLSDDGQRSLRYTPFYANSGFYYLRSNPRTEYFAWNILMAFDLLHITGSHQNIFTIQLMEGLDLSGLRVKLLTLREFPSGVKFNHDKPFMRAIKDGHERPYMFHMCWTLNKYDKLRNFRASSMWFVNEAYSEELGTLHHVDESSEGSASKLMLMAEQFQLDNTPVEVRWKKMASTICVRP